MRWRWYSPLEDVFGEEVEWRELTDTNIVENINGDTATTLGFCDLSPLLRVGAKGKVVKKSAPAVNRSAVMETGALCCRLSEDELLLLAAPDGTAAVLSDVMSTPPRVLLPRRDSHCWIGLCGHRAPEVLSLLCAVPAVAGEVLQTRVADISALVISESRTSVPAFHLLADSGYALHLWEMLQTAAAPRDGGAIGWRQWRELFAHS